MHERWLMKCWGPFLCLNSSYFILVSTSVINILLPPCYWPDNLFCLTRTLIHSLILSSALPLLSLFHTHHRASVTQHVGEWHVYARSSRCLQHAWTRRLWMSHAPTPPQTSSSPSSSLGFAGINLPSVIAVIEESKVWEWTGRCVIPLPSLYTWSAIS